MQWQPWLITVDHKDWHDESKRTMPTLSIPLMRASLSQTYANGDNSNYLVKIRNITLSNRKKNIYKYGSQPPLTLAIGNDFEHLNASWNVKVPQMNRYFKEYGNDADICLLHWVGGSKPWEGHGQFQDWWKNYDLQVNRTTMVEAVEKNRAEKARKWKAKVALKREKRLMLLEMNKWIEASLADTPPS